MTINKNISHMTSYRLQWVSLILIALLMPIMVVGQEQSEGLTPEELTKIEQVGEVELSDSGELVAYTLSKQADPYEKNKPAQNHLYVRDLSSEESLPYVTTMSVSEIAFRPNEESITFLGKRSGDERNGIFEISISGGEAQKIFSFKQDIASYSWGPDGNHLAFMAPDTAKEPESDLPYQPEIYEENLTQRRGFVTNIAKEGHQPHQLQVNGSVYQMHWSPNGKRLAIAVAPTPLVDDYYMSQQVKIVNLRGSEVYTEVDHEGKLGDIAWSPDGSRLAMIAGADIHDPIDGRLFVVSAEDGSVTQLQPQLEQKFEQFEWIDNNTIQYLTSEGVWSNYGSINVDGTGMETIVDVEEPNITSFDRAEDGTVVFSASSSKHPRELFSLKSGETQRLTNSNPWLDEVALGQQKVVKWTANDGTELQGVLVYPLNYEKGTKYPMITTVHGGPEAHYDHGWVTSYSDPGQVAAAQGYFVFYPNYRGSTGRGEDFAKSSQGDLAGAEFDDIVAGVDELVSVGLVDETKIGVTGGSYGGYATGWMSTRYTDKFAAGVMFVGISNNISKWGTSDIPEELYLVHARERIWNDYQDFLERSPIYYTGQADTPLLIMHGKNDTRVSPSQSYEMYRHIKTRTNTPVRLVLYPGEGHGNVNATARYDYNLRMMRWFNTYLKGEGEEKPDDQLQLQDTITNN
ncbi:S9 family peptidase [Aliifodinibius salicampi]|uniref:S9 family peptidase n=1 Tax=Fodinibius salicampi TaxID=1920655 RepID=A0ABT3Q125_9BACT|nr:S9 family peptidase [Fodinibius salicampi]MCW9713803.1 S9 family peptidase [Fodinibius salicampi]